MNNWENSRNRNSYRNTLNDRVKSDKAVLEKKDSDNVVILDKVGYVAQAEKVILEMNKNKNKITTTKIRSILRMLNQLQREAVQRQKEELDEEFQSSLQYYKMRCVYEAGRDPHNVKMFMERSQLITLVDWIGSSKSNFLLYCHYVEALVAFHRYYGGKD